MECSRCKKDSASLSMSFLNTEMICPDCNDEERKHPVYQKAKDAELKEVRKGNYNYRGLYADMSWEQIKIQK